MSTLSVRDRQPEVMDEPGLDERLHHQALEGLRRGNVVSNVARVLWRGLEASGVLQRAAPIRVLDLACGGGDVSLGLARLARRHSIRVEVHGADVSLLAIEHARAAAERAGIADVRYFHLNALLDPLPSDFDAIYCTLFLHHLSEADQVELLRHMAAATRSVVLVDDLVRTRLGFALVWIGCHLLTRSPVVHTDGPLSVRAALTLEEAGALAKRAGLHGAIIERHWPERFLLRWRKS
ncbi:MAG: methyltransferase domain-containing protein [Pirellulales bacterium]